MREKKIRVLAKFILAFCFISIAKAQCQSYGYEESPTFHHDYPSVYEDAPYWVEQDHLYPYEPITNPETYSNTHYYYRHSAKGQKFSGDINFGRRYDNSANFSTGISSYQGTSTGPGPNGGYPGTPRGVYQTDYYDTSLYPNTYMRVYPN